MSSKPSPSELTPSPRRSPVARVLVTLVAFLGLGYVLGHAGVGESASGHTAMLLGLLLLAAYLGGKAVAHLGLPRITGYMMIGIVAGPYVLGVVPREAVVDFRLVNGVALSVIALQAGGELRIKRLRGRLKSIAVVSLLQTVVIFGAILAVVYLGRNLIGFLEFQPSRRALAAAIVFGLVAVAKSPATTIAVITEEKAAGSVTDTVLGITVVKDVVVLVLIALLIPLAATVADPSVSLDLHLAREILVAIVLSVGVGALGGWGIGWYFARIQVQPVLFILGIAFLSVELAEWLGLEYILLSMTAGFVVENFSSQGPELLDALEKNALPVYALFFAVGGADLDISVLRAAWAIAAVIIVGRGVALWGSTWLGSRMVNDPLPVRRYAWMGFLAQAGVTLGVANMVRDRLPEMGAQIAAIIIAMIAVNQLVGPPAFRYGLLRAGESGR